jgi:hypothetical protein
MPAEIEGAYDIRLREIELITVSIMFFCLHAPGGLSEVDTVHKKTMPKSSTDASTVLPCYCCTSSPLDDPAPAQATERIRFSPRPTHRSCHHVVRGGSSLECCH